MPRAEREVLLVSTSHFTQPASAQGTRSIIPHAFGRSVPTSISTPQLLKRVNAL
jgi:hypothetical protein